MGLFKGRGGKHPPVPEPLGPGPGPVPAHLTVEQAVSPLHLATNIGWHPEVVGASDGDGNKMRLEGCTLKVQARPPNTTESVTYEFFFDKADVHAVVVIAMHMQDYAVNGKWDK